MMQVSSIHKQLLVDAVVFKEVFLILVETLGKVIETCVLGVEVMEVGARR